MDQYINREIDPTDFPGHHLKASGGSKTLGARERFAVDFHTGFVWLLSWLGFYTTWSTFVILLININFFDFLSLIEIFPYDIVSGLSH